MQEQHKEHAIGCLKGMAESGHYEAARTLLAYARTQSDGELEEYALQRFRDQAADGHYEAARDLLLYALEG